nr:MAG: ORF1 [TTV-like mini virus]
MPWRRPYYQRRRRWIRYRRPRYPFRPRWRPRRRRRYYKRVRPKKLNSIIVKEYQPRCIHKCKIKGHMSLLWTSPERFSNNFDMYDVTAAPEKLPSGGGFSIKNFTLTTLWSEHEALRNIWTKTNLDLPLTRYTGVTIKLWASERLDYVVTWDNQLPLRSNQDMYHTMHPGLHTLLKNKIIVPSKRTNPRTKPYKKIKIKPPTLLLNKWHFQFDIAKTPLLQLRTSSLDLDEFYIPKKSISTTITIPYLNTGLIQNTKFQQNSPNGWYCKYHGTQKIYLYTFPNEVTNDTKLNTCKLLANTDTYQLGTNIPQKPTGQLTINYTYKDWGNPFHKDYMTKNKLVYQSNLAPATLLTLLGANWDVTVHDAAVTTLNVGFTQVFLTDAIRYNPYHDTGEDNLIYFVSNKDENKNWATPDNPDLYSSGYPLWVLSFGFADFQKHLGKLQRIDTDHIVVLKFKQTPVRTLTMPLLSPDFITGKSPYENTVNIEDKDRWHPAFQYQQKTLNTIAYSGPGSPKLPTLEVGQAKITYCFYFKWGGNPPPMSRIEDPRNEPSFPVPNNFQRTNSLQNPETAPEMLLYNFDQRRGYLTKSAIKRLTKDILSEKSTLTDLQERHLPEIQRQEETSSESSTEEEGEEQTTQDLLRKLRNHRQQQHKLKRLILQKLLHQ